VCHGYLKLDSDYCNEPASMSVGGRLLKSCSVMIVALIPWISIDSMCPQFGKILLYILLVVIDDDNHETRHK
jgi:hypothetical protein